ncbi:MAG: hypothetical protein OXU19_13940 [bacterium]|nr:hypothetical protein [bacterium]
MLEVFANNIYHVVARKEFGSLMETFVGIDRSVDNFRRWVLSDWKSPTTRALLAEYYVRIATGTDSEGADDFNYVDIVLEDGSTIEVKATALLQPARNNKLERSSAKFAIGKKSWAWDDRSWDWLPSPDAPKRWADCYVLCLENMDDPTRYDPLDLAQWEFFVIPTFTIDEVFGDQKSVTVGRLKQEGFCSVGFVDLAEEISDKLEM